MKVGYEGIDQGNQIIELEAQVAALQREVAAKDAGIAAIVAALGCHPAYVLQEIGRLKSLADERQNKDGYRQLQMQLTALRADKAALEIRERELERDLEVAMSQCAILSADVERVAVAFHLWPGASGDMAQAFAAFRASKDYPK